MSLSTLRPTNADSLLSDDEIRNLRDKHYNAEVVGIVEVHEDLLRLRVRPEWGSTAFLPGQYTVLGLGNWEPRVGGVDDEVLSSADCRKLLKRAYSIACPMLDDGGHLVPPTYGDFLEFYIVLVRHREEHPPGLTPRLFHLAVGDRLCMGHKTTGHYTLDAVQPTDNIVFVATGTGEAPHTAMVAELLSVAHAGRLVVVTCARSQRDLAYRETFQELERRYPTFQYVALTTREPENLDPTRADYVGKRYVQQFFDSGELERTMNWPLNPDETHVFLCGNPQMIGAPVRGATGPDRYPKPRGMIEVLESRGFRTDEPGQPGNIHFEKYW